MDTLLECDDLVWSKAIMTCKTHNYTNALQILCPQVVPALICSLIEHQPMLCYLLHNVSLYNHHMRSSKLVWNGPMVIGLLMRRLMRRLITSLCCDWLIQMWPDGTIERSVKGCRYIVDLPLAYGKSHNILFALWKCNYSDRKYSNKTSFYRSLFFTGMTCGNLFMVKPMQ